LINSLLHDVLGMDSTQATTVIRLVDKMHKLSHEAFIAQLDALFSPTQREHGGLEILQAFLQTTKLDTMPESLNGHESVRLLQQLMSLLESAGITNVQFDPALMRGFDYYTDIVFEVVDNDSANNRSMFGGGRY